VEALAAERSASANQVIASRLPSAIALVAGDDPAKRLEVLEGVLWGIDHLTEILQVMKESANRLAAREVLMAPPFSLTQNQATGVLDLSVEAVTADRRQQLVEEIEALRRHGHEDPS
jgi:DNA gyrase/topoisomerase IV subunit A